jgi:hypothetical protein
MHREDAMRLLGELGDVQVRLDRMWNHPPVGRTPRLGGSHANGDREEARAGSASG